MWHESVVILCERSQTEKTQRTALNLHETSRKGNPEGRRINGNGCEGVHYDYIKSHWPVPFPPLDSYNLC